VLTKNFGLFKRLVIFILLHPYHYKVLLFKMILRLQKQSWQDWYWWD